MRKGNLSLLTVFLSVVLSLAAVSFLKPGGQGEVHKESAYERVMRTGVIRCGYYSFSPVVMRDPNTNEMSGLSIDMMNVIAAKTGLKVEWTEESTFGNWITALQANRYDVMCAPMWSDMALGREAIYTRPLYYAAIAPLVRADDTRFDGPEGWKKLNSPDATLVVQDGNMIGFLTKEVFPNAKLLTMPALMDGPMIVQNVVTGKADAILLDVNAVIEYNKRNEVKLKMLPVERPLKAQPFVIPLQHEETELREFMDNAVQDLLVSGTMDRLLDKWEAQKGVFLRVAQPFEGAK